MATTKQETVEKTPVFVGLEMDIGAPNGPAWASLRLVFEGGARVSIGDLNHTGLNGPLMITKEALAAAIAAGPK